MSRRRLAALATVFFTAASTLALIPQLAEVAKADVVPPGPGLPPIIPLKPENLDKVPHWSISAPTTQQAGLANSLGELTLGSTSAGASSGPAPAAAAAESSMAAMSSTADAPDLGGEWPTGNRSRARTGNAAWEQFITVPLQTSWIGTTLDKVQLNPAIVDDTAYFGGAGSDRRVYAVDLQTGGLKWNVQIPGSVLGSPTVSNGWVYFAGADGRLYRVATTSALSWQWPAATANPVGSIIGSPALHNGIVYVGSRDGFLYAVDAATGALLWSVQTPEGITSSVTVSDGKIFVTSGANEWLSVYDVATHALLWQRHFYTWANPDTVGTAASVSGGKVFFTGMDSKLHILYEADGTDVVAPVSIGSWAQNTPVTSAERVFIGTNDGRVMAFSRVGAHYWTQTLPNNAIVSSPVFANGMLFASSTDGTMYVMDAFTGAAKWGYATQGSLFAPPAIVSNRVILGSDDHNVYGLGPDVPVNQTFPGQPLAHRYGLHTDELYSWDPVSTSTGNYTLAATDIATKSRGIPVSMDRAYNALDAATDGPLGFGWTFSANTRLTVNPADITVRWGDGRQDVYTGGPTTWTGPPDTHETLTAVAGGYDLAAKKGVVFHFDTTGRLKTVKDASSNTTTFGYDGSGRLVTMTDPSNHTLTLGYNPAGRIATVTDPLNQTWQYGYNAAGELTSVKDPANGETLYTYDAAHRLETITDPDGNLVIDNTYDAAGRVIDQVDSAGAHWTYTYNADNTVVTDPLGHPTTYRFDANMRTTSVTNALGHSRQMVYDAESNLVASVDANGNVSRFAYDDKGNVVATLDPLGHKSEFSYDANGNVVSVTSLKGTVASFTYDSAHRLTDAYSPTGVHRHMDYRPDGLLAAVTDGVGQATLEYDANGMPTGSRDALLRLTQTAIDAGGRLLSVTDPLNRVTAYTYDAMGRVKTVTDPANETTTYTYDKSGRVKTVTDANLHTTTYGYDGRGLLTSTKDALNRTRTWTYDKARRLTSMKNARGQTISFGYDNADRRTSITAPGAPTVTFEYDNAGRMTKVVDGTGTRRFAYDKASRVLSETRDHVSATLVYEYDMLGRRVDTKLYRGGGLFAHNALVYDDDNRIVHVTDSAGGGTDFGYDAEGKLVEVKAPNAVKTTYNYDAADQLIDVRTTREATTGAANLLAQYQYGYDAAGRRTWRARSIANTAFMSYYGYDNADRLVSTTTNEPQAPPTANASYTYDGVGNRLSRTLQGVSQTTTNYTYDAADQLLSDGTTEYDYDADGNLIRRRVQGAPLPTTITSYSWDSLSRMTSQTTGLATTSYAYDGAGRRVGRSDATGATTYVYDGADVLEEITTGQVSGEAVETTVGGMALNRITFAGTTYFHPDGNGNVSELSNSNGLLVGRYSYDPFGLHSWTPSTTTSTDALLLGRHSFSGQAGVRDEAGGLMDMRSRMYDPSLGRFISVDPLAARTGERYQYVGNNPVSYLDPFGLSECGQFSLGGLVDCASKVDDAAGAVVDGLGNAAGAVGDFVGDVANSGPAQFVKGWFNDISIWTGAVAGVAAAVTLVCAVCAVVTLPIIAVVGGVSTVTGFISTAIECADGGAGMPCAVGIASSLLGMVGGRAFAQLVPDKTYQAAFDGIMALFGAGVSAATQPSNSGGSGGSGGGGGGTGGGGGGIIIIPVPIIPPRPAWGAAIGSAK